MSCEFVYAFYLTANISLSVFLLFFFCPYFMLVIAEIFFLFTLMDIGYL